MRLAIYVGTYHKYNCGSLNGEWIHIQDFVDKGEFYEYIRELHSDEDDGLTYSGWWSVTYNVGYHH